MKVLQVLYVAVSLLGTVHGAPSQERRDTGAVAGTYPPVWKSNDAPAEDAKYPPDWKRDDSQFDAAKYPPDWKRDESQAELATYPPPGRATTPRSRVPHIPLIGSATNLKRVPQRTLRPGKQLPLKIYLGRWIMPSHGDVYETRSDGGASGSVRRMIIRTER